MERAKGNVTLALALSPRIRWDLGVWGSLFVLNVCLFFINNELRLQSPSPLQTSAPPPEQPGQGHRTPPALAKARGSARPSCRPPPWPVTRGCLRSAPLRAGFVVRRGFHGHLAYPSTGQQKRALASSGPFLRVEKRNGNVSFSLVSVGCLSRKSASLDGC